MEQQRKNYSRQLETKTNALAQPSLFPQINVVRFWLVVFIFVCWMAFIGARLVYLQTAQHEFLLEKAVDQRRRELRTKPLRGSILDRQGRELATTLEVDSLWTDPTELENVEATAYKLAPLLNEKPKNLVFELTEAKAAKRRFLWLGRKIENAQVEKIKSLNLNGLYWRKEQKRVYPNGALAAHVLGFTNRDDVGQAGVESIQEKNLRGDYTEVTTERDGSGKIYELTENIVQSPRDVVLTIDSSIQFHVEQALAAGIDASKAKSGAAVVLDPKTGEVLAMATAPKFNPNNLGDLKPEMWTNRAVQNIYEPGSTFKLVTYSAALEEGIAGPDDQIDCSAGFIKVGSREIKDTSRAGVISLTDALARSSNVAAITLGQKVGKDRLYEYIRRFGYASETGIELPAEARGKLYPPEKWTPDSIGSVPIGYEVGVTTIQAAAAFGVIANDGVRIAPHLIKEIREEDGRILPPNTPESHRVVSEMTARQMRQMLEAVTVQGTAKRAQLEGYTAAGKTGTAHKYDPKKRRYSNTKYVASFVGFAPIVNPAVVIAVMLDEPSGSAHHGGDVAAPIFRDIADQILPEMHIIPDSLPREPTDNVLTEEQSSPNRSKTLIEPSQAANDKNQKSAEKIEKAFLNKAQTDSKKEKTSIHNRAKDVAENKKLSADTNRLNVVKTKLLPVNKNKAEALSKAVNSSKTKGKT